MSNTADNTASSSNTAGIGESTTAPIRPNNTDNTNASAMGTAAASTTMTMTVAPPQNDNDRVLPLTLVNRPSVTWEEGTIDNENMGKKSSKRCCIFHKPRAFGESSTDTSDYDSDGKYGSNNKKIARKKTPGKKKTPDHLRFHA